MSVRQIGQPRPSSRTRLAHEEQKRWCSCRCPSVACLTTAMVWRINDLTQPCCRCGQQHYRRRRRRRRPCCRCHHTACCCEHHKQELQPCLVFHFQRSPFCTDNSLWADDVNDVVAGAEIRQLSEHMLANVVLLYCCWLWTGKLNMLKFMHARVVIDPPT